MYPYIVGRMLKIFPVLLGLLLLSTVALADITIVNPIEETFSDQEVLKLGTAAQGETFEIIVSNDTGMGDSIRWDSLAIGEETLPDGWVAFSTNQGERRVGVTIGVPDDAPPNVYQLTLVATNTKLNISHTVYARVEVKENLMNAAISNTGLNENPLVEEKVSYSISLTNNSIAPHKVVVSADLPDSWYAAKELTVPPKKTITETLDITPRSFGRKDFSFSVSSALTEREIVRFNSVLLVRPTLEGKLNQTIYGFPFFTVSMLPFYYFNTVLAELI